MDRDNFWEGHSAAAHLNSNAALQPQSPQIKFENSSGAGESSSSGNSKHLVCKEEQQSIFRYCEGNLNFATVSNADDDDFGFQKKKALSRDPMSHRIIEKRRRDRMNNCLADLSRLIPAEYLKKGRGRVEKTEIIEMAIKHMKHLQAHACNHKGPDSAEPPATENPAQVQNSVSAVEHYRLGYQECLSETMHFLVEVEGYFAGDSLCVQLISHLQKHCEKILKGDRLNFNRPMRSETSSSSSRGYSGYSGGPSSTSSGSDSGGNGHSSSSKENVACNTEWRRQNDMDETPSPIPLSMTSGGHQVLPPPPPPQPILEQADSPSPTSDAGSETSSQLREMLTGSGSGAASSTASGVLQRRPSDHSESGALYKFKNNIKQRFTAEHHHDEKRRRLTSPSAAGGQESAPAPSTAAPASVVVKLRDSIDSPPPPNQSTRIRSPSPTGHPPPASSPPFGVPVFALHSKGSFYIPLTIDNEMLAPYMSAFNEHNQILHPVTISVNFCRMAAGSPMTVQQQATPMVPWRGEPPGLVPLPKWSVCDRA